MKIILLLTMLVVGLTLNAQTVPPGVFQIKSPLSLKGVYTFGRGDSLVTPVGAWGNGNVDKAKVSGFLAVVTSEDSLAMTPLKGSYTGKILLVHRGASGTLGGAFATKALNAQSAGAIAVVVINNGFVYDNANKIIGIDSNQVIGMQGLAGATETAATSTGLGVKIPVIMISLKDGVKIKKALKTEAIEAYIGVRPVFDNDISINNRSVSAPKVRTKVTALSRKGEVDESFALYAFNIGYNYQKALRARVKIEYNQVVTKNSKDTIIKQVIFRDSIVWRDSVVKQFLKDSLTGGNKKPRPIKFAKHFTPDYDLPKGDYFVTYSVSLVDTTGIATKKDAELKDINDEYLGDNSWSYSFHVRDSIYSIAPLSTYTFKTTGKVFKDMPRSGYNYLVPSSTFKEKNYQQSVCIVFEEKFGSRIKAEGIQFSVANKLGNSLKNQFLTIDVFEWADKFKDLNDTAFKFKTLNKMIDKQEFIITDDLSTSFFYAKFDYAQNFENDKRYLVCVNSKDSLVQFGFDPFGSSITIGKDSPKVGVVQSFIAGLYMPYMYQSYSYTPGLTLKVSTPGVSRTTVSSNCNYDWNGKNYKESGTYVYDTKTKKGGDSTAYLVLTIINKPITSTIRFTAKDSVYNWNGTKYTKSGIYTYSTKAVKGCDSTATLILTILAPGKSTTDTTACGSFVWNGTKYTKSGAYDFVIKDTTGKLKDSTATLLLAIKELPKKDLVLDTNASSLTASQVDAVYQWLNCDANKVEIANSTAQVFKPAKKGNYAVKITLNGCVDTSACVAVKIAGLEVAKQSEFRIYPNPNNGVFNVAGLPIGTYKLLDMVGAEVYRFTVLTDEIQKLNVTNLTNGVYYIVDDSRQIVNNKVVITH